MNCLPSRFSTCPLGLQTGEKNEINYTVTAKEYKTIAERINRLAITKEYKTGAERISRIEISREH